MSKEELSAESPVDSFTHPQLAVRELRDYTQFLSGKIKTIVDASIEDPQRRKAIKDLVHNAIWSEAYTPAMEWCQEIAHDVNRGAAEQTHRAFPFTSGQYLPLEEVAA